LQLTRNVGILLGMIVCVCNAIREEQLRTAARQGARSPGSAYARVGCKAKCGTCLPFARQIIEEERARTEQMPAANAA
jgi:bacterioferritin-associated ferredoxin